MTLDLFPDETNTEASSHNIDVDAGVSKIESWKNDLRTKLEALDIAFSAFTAGAAKLRGLVFFKEETIYGYQLIEQIFDVWIDELCNEYTENSGTVGHIRIERSNLPKDIQSLSLPYCDDSFESHTDSKRTDRNKATIKSLSAWALDNFDFEKLERKLSIMANKLDERSFRCAAETLCFKFGLYSRIDQTEKRISTVKGRPILEVSHNYSYYHRSIEALDSLIRAAKTFENESGSIGLSECIEQLKELEDDCWKSNNKFIGSGTKVNFGGAVHLVNYKDKLKFHLSPEIFEALICFIGEYDQKNELLKVSFK